MSIRKRVWGDGREGWIADYRDANRRRHIKTFQRKRDAEAWLVQAKGELASGIHTPASTSITVAAAGEMWLQQGAADGLEAATIRQYRQHLHLHIAPLIGAVKLAELTPATLQDFRNALHQNGRSRAMVKKVMTSLGTILATAMANGRVARNVVREQARQTRRQNRIAKRHERRLEIGRDIPTKDEIRAMLAAAQGRWRPLLVVAVFTGLRASELRGLRWADIDLDASELVVRQRADRWSVLGPPKSDSGKRRIPLAPLVINSLREWRVACPRGDLNLVFPNGVGRVETLQRIRERGLGPVQAAAGISDDPRRPRYGLHSLRHAAASLFIEEGFSPKRVQALMGHSSIATTHDVYGHLWPSAAEDQVAMRRLQARLIGA